MTDPTPNTGIKGRRLPGGLTVIELGWDQFVEDYKAARHDPRKLTMLDERGMPRRPAVFTNPERTVCVAPDHAVWGIKCRQLKLGGVRIGKRERACKTCGEKLTMTREYSDAWTFRCDVCKAVAIYTKSEVGGTIGAGESEKV